MGWDMHGLRHQHVTSIGMGDVGRGGGEGQVGLDERLQASPPASWTTGPGFDRCHRPFPSLSFFFREIRPKARGWNKTPSGWG